MKNPATSPEHCFHRFFLIPFFFLILFSTLSFCQTTVPAGDVSGTWTKAGSPYLVTGSINIESGKKLTIMPGVEIRFAQYANLIVRNTDTIIAAGNKESMIVFTSDKPTPSPGDWDGIILYGTGESSSFRHVVVQYATSGLTLRASASGCSSNRNYAKVDSCVFRNNSQDGLYIAASGSSYSGCTFPKRGVSSPDVTNCLIYNNRNGISLWANWGFMSGGYVGAYINRNLIYNNSKNGIYCSGDDPIEADLVNNTIVNNAENGIYYGAEFDSTEFEIVNNIISDNATGIWSEDTLGANIRYNNVWRNTKNYVNLAPAVTDISVDPLFADPEENDFNLTSTSPCIDAGDPAMADPDASVPDIGALYYAEPPAADFEANTISGIYPYAVNFSDLSTGSILQWSWDFGDGTGSAEHNPNHTYTAAGIYTVSLTVTGAGGSDTESKAGYITILAPPPVAAFTSDKTSGIMPLTVSFTDNSTGEISGWSWDFGDATTSTTQNPGHNYATAGTYTVTLTVTGPGGTDTETKTDYISVNYPPPVAAFTCDKTSGDAPLTIAFTDNSTGEISTWAWDFGDGGKSTAQNPGHTYPNTGTFAVSLIVTGSGGADTLTKTDYITVTGVSGLERNTGNGILSVYPNPAKMSCVISFSMEEPALANLVVYDSQGQLVSEIHKGLLSADDHEFIINVIDLPAGLYYVALITNSTCSIQKLVIVK